MNRTTICKAQALMCRERAGHRGVDEVLWLARAQRWDRLADSNEPAVGVRETAAKVNSLQAQDREGGTPPAEAYSRN